MRGCILGNDIQRKETLGESKMEKPVMYICKLQPGNEEVTIRTTQVTSYKKCSNVEEGRGSERKNSENEDCEETGQKADTLKKETERENVEKQVQATTEDFTARHYVKRLVSKDDTSSFHVESHGESEVQENTKSELSLSTSASEDFNTGSKETENELISNGDQDKVITKVKMPSYGSERFSSGETEVAENKQVSINNEKTKAKLAVSSNDSEKLTNQSKEISEQDLISVEIEENENAKRELSLPASDDPPAEFREKKNSPVHVERSRTPEIDESIAVEVLSTSLFSGAPGFSQYYGTTCLPDRTITSNSYRNVSATDVYTSGSHRYETLKNPSYGDMSVVDVQTSLNEGVAKQRCSVSNDEPFLDVEAWEPELEEDQLEVHLLENEGSSNNPNGTFQQAVSCSK